MSTLISLQSEKEREEQERLCKQLQKTVDQLEGVCVWGGGGRGGFGLFVDDLQLPCPQIITPPNQHQPCLVFATEDYPGPTQGTVTH